MCSLHHQRKYFKEEFGLHEPSERKLGQELVRKYCGGSSSLVSKGHYCYDVDFLKSLESLLQIDELLEQIENPHFNESDVMADMCDGEAFRSHPLYGIDPQALQVILYYDDLEICNPLGSSVKKHKLGAFYFTLGNILPRNRSLLHSIQLLAIAKTSIIQLYGIDVILETFMTSIKILEEGYDFLVRGTQRNMKGTLLLVAADNLASHYVGGYKALHSALRKCRYCLATGVDMSMKVWLLRSLLATYCTIKYCTLVYY
ncbi:uncharacterized protein LOC134176418 [Corticium candelabrum]|uniref:uncharacterized protein LOC134176418 n=1 Tax=Corticium candelabrum TaxID=121492 RepID=UPI002E273BCF|nr:uncharacterized protein LOC134176418 [Corticium candelabrum]